MSAGSERLLRSINKGSPEQCLDLDDCFDYQAHGMDGHLSSMSPQSALSALHPNALSCNNVHWSQPSPSLDADEESFYQLTFAIRQLVQANAAANSSCAPNKEKRRDAAISLHLQLLRDSSVEDAYFVSDSSDASYSSGTSSQFLQGSESPGPGEKSLSVVSSEASTHPPSTPASSVSSSKTEAKRTASAPVRGGVEMVLDLNMNASTCLPKKQKPRSQAQRESYVIARRNGVCEKHRKQHKRCHCLDNVSPRISPGKKMKAQAMRSEKQQIQTLDTREALQFVQSTYECLQKEVSDETEPVGVIVPSTERYTCLIPSCTYTSGTVASLQRHYSKHSCNPPGITSTAGSSLSPRSHTFQPLDSPVWWSSLDGSSLSVPGSVSVQPPGKTFLEHMETSSDGSTTSTTSPTTGTSSTNSRLDYKLSRITPVNESTDTSPGQSEGERYNSQPQLWREKQQKHVIQHLQNKKGGGFGDVMLANVYTALPHSGILAVIHFWRFAMAAVYSFWILHSATADISCGQRHRAYSLVA